MRWSKISLVRNPWYTFGAWPLRWLGDSTHFNANFTGYRLFLRFGGSDLNQVQKIDTPIVGAFNVVVGF